MSDQKENFNTNWIELIDPITKIGGSINLDLGYNYNIIKNLNVGIFARAQTMLSASIYPPIDGASTGTIETLTFGIILNNPIFLVY